MAVVKLFTYGTLMHPARMSSFINPEKILDLRPAVISGKMYTMEAQRFPVVIRANEGRRARAPLTVYGALYTLDLEYDDFVTLDGYEGCSKAPIGMNLPEDLYHRHVVKAKEIAFENMLDFMDFKYEVGEEHECFVYFGNMKNNYINMLCTQDRRKNGVVWRDFFNIF
jgi:gamma-glutamylcyclotransferase (GGCT)/AIG2-like uncharacterized protein YtfP